MRERGEGRVRGDSKGKVRYRCEVIIVEVREFQNESGEMPRVPSPAFPSVAHLRGKKGLPPPNYLTPEIRTHTYTHMIF